MIDDVFAEMRRKHEGVSPAINIQEVGTVTAISSGVARIDGLPGAGYQELLKLPGDAYCIALDLEEGGIGAVLLCDDEDARTGSAVMRTGRTLDVPVGRELLGRVVNPLGRPVDGKGPVSAQTRWPIERTAPAIMDRAPVNRPLQTGIKVVDAMIPVGRGQRELILGDRQTGKTTIAVDTIVNQHDKNVICVYCAIGQRSSAVAEVVANLEAKGAMAYTVVLVTEGNDPSGLQYIAPYAATTVAEYFMESGNDVLIVYDDLTKHARAYREMSLLLNRPPGREAFPGDIFYLHSRLLERSTQLNEARGNGSLTAFPVVETEAQNMSAYIPTNLISITDGQLYLSPKLFSLGILPAVDVGKSVSRVGGKAQWEVFRKVAGKLKLTYAQFEELEVFARFGARLDKDTRRRIEHGRKIRQTLAQPQLQPLSVAEQVMVFLALTNHSLDEIPDDGLAAAEAELHRAARELPRDVTERVFTSGKLTDKDRDILLKHIKNALERFELPAATDAKKEQQP